MALFVIVGKNEPIYETDFTTGGISTTSSGNSVLAKGASGGGGNSTDETAYLNQFIVHSSLDMLEKNMWMTYSMNLKLIDRFNGQLVHAFLTAGSTAFVLLHDGSRSEDSILSFFKEIYELYVKLSMNPFFEFDRPIVSANFDNRVRALEKRFLR